MAGQEHPRADADSPESAESTRFRATWQPKERAFEPRNAYLTALNGALVGRTFRIGSGRLIVGRADDCDVVLADHGVSRRHALFVATPDGRVALEDLGSTNGTSVNGRLVGVEQLEGGERLQFGSDTVFKFEFRDTLEERYATYLYESATQDRLTGVFNERYLREQLNMEFAWHRRHDLPLSLIFLDVDRFKLVNDRYGHPAGDDVLRQVAMRCHGMTRTEDVFARYGGEEFVCLLRHTAAGSATVLAERMRRAVADAPFAISGHGATCSIDVTLSAGVAQLDVRMKSPEALIAEADRLLYQAKKGGRNRVAPAAALKQV